ncbi:inner nuclear membrane protein enriched at telomere/subtelomere region, partial [Lobosporangium transversale]
MASTESTHYLHPDFDVTKITMNQIREILSEHHVKLPTGMVKKQQLIDLFNQHIRPQVPEINESDTSDSDRETKATSKATTTSATPKTTRARQSRAKKAADDDADDEDNETPPSMASASTRKKRIASKAKVDNDEPAQAEVKPRLKRSTSRARATTEKNNVESKMEEPSRGRNIQRTVTQSEDESEPVRLQRPKKKDENFSYENPFQSGSESERRRSRPRSRSRSSTRKARVERADAMENVFKVPAQPQFSRFMRTPEPDKSESSHSRTKPAATSATTTTTTTTTTSAAEDKKTAKAHSTPKKVSTDGLPTPKHRDMASTLDFIDQDFVKTLRQNVGPISLVLAIVLLAYGIWLRQKRIEIGFCTEAELEPTVRPWYYPTCIPCPDRATCLRSDEKPICPPEYILKPQLLSFGNLFPITPVCVLNKAKGYRAFQVADAAEKLLHLHAGNIECSLLRDKAAPDSMEYKARRGLSVDELRFHVEQLKDSNVSDEEFSEYWNIAVKELRRRSNKVVFEEGLASEERIRSLKPQKSLGCRLRQVLVRWIIKFRLFFL